MDKLERVIDRIEHTIDYGDMLNLFEMGIALKVLEERLWGIDFKLSQKCNRLQHKIIEGTEAEKC
mgnify:CR=1 FL=1